MNPKKDAQKKQEQFLEEVADPASHATSMLLTGLTLVPICLILAKLDEDRCLEHEARASSFHDQNIDNFHQEIVILYCVVFNAT